MTAGRHGPGEAADLWSTGRLLATAARLAEHAFTAHLHRLGLTPASLRVLHALGAGPLTQRELAARCQVQAQTLSRTVEGLERGGHVARRRDVADRRRVQVRITRRGTRALHAVGDLRLADLEILDQVESPEVFRRQLLQIVRVLGSHRWPPEAPPDA